MTAKTSFSKHQNDLLSMINETIDLGYDVGVRYGIDPIFDSLEMLEEIEISVVRGMLIREPYIDKVNVAAIAEKLRSWEHHEELKSYFDKLRNVWQSFTNYQLMRTGE